MPHQTPRTPMTWKHLRELLQNEAGRIEVLLRSRRLSKMARADLDEMLANLRRALERM